MVTRHKVFISYHHELDEEYTARLLHINDQYSVFIDRSVDTGDINPDLSDENIRVIIRDKYLRDSTVTILLVGKETAHRKHVDWELYSSMYDGPINKKSGILVITLPTVEHNGNVIAAHGDVEKENVYPEISNWTNLGDRKQIEDRYPYLPARIVDQLVADNVKVSVTTWKYIQDAVKLQHLIDLAHRSRHSNQYDLSRPMMRKNT